MSARDLSLARRASRTPDAAALVIGDRCLRFAELAARVDRVAELLRARGIGPGDRIAALLPNGLAFAELVHAALACRAVLLPLNTRLTARELAHPLRDAEPALLVHGGALAARAAESRALVPEPPPALCVDADLAAALAPDAPGSGATARGRPPDLAPLHGETKTRSRP